MDKHITLFDGAIDSNIYLFIINLLLIFFCFYSWYKFCYKKGYKLDFWHYSIFLPFFITCFLMYPFSGSLANYIALGAAIELVNEKNDFTYLLCVMTFLSAYLGFYICSIHFVRKQPSFFF